MDESSRCLMNVSPPDKQKVLIADDEKTQRKILQNHLEALGYDVLMASSGTEARRLWDEHRVRIVISDLEMADGDGFELVTHIRDNETCHTYVMILTTNQEKEKLITGLTLQVDDFVTKPIIKQELALRLQAANRLLRLEDHDKLVIAFSEMVALRSCEPAPHLKRMKRFCKVMTEELYEKYPDLGLNSQLVEDITNLSVLHDIGKITIPEEIVTKKGGYSTQEFEIMKQHTINGANIFKELYLSTGSTFLRTAFEIILFHHEKWDGTGYPYGLQGQEIPLPARIVTFSDILDTILSRRPYKDPLPFASAAKLIAAERGKQLDPEIVDVFEHSAEMFEEIHNLCAYDNTAKW